MINARHIAFLVLCCLGFQVSGQHTELDSLKALAESTAEDSVRVRLLNEMAGILYRTDPESAIKYSGDARMIAEQADFQPGLAEAYKNLGLGYYMLGDYEAAFRNWNPSLRIFQVLGDEKKVANIIGNQGSIYYTIGQNVQAVENYLKALKIAEKLNDSIRIATLLLNIGLVYADQPGAHDSSASYYLRALEIGDAIGYKNLLGVGEVNLGELYLSQGAHDSALVHFERSLEILQSEIDISTSLNFIGRTYAEKGDLDRAIQYHEDALEMAEQQNAKLEMVKILLGLASAYLSQEEARSALNHFERAMEIAKEIGTNYQLSAAYGGLAESFAALSDYRSAYTYLSLQYEIDNVIYQIESDNKTDNLMYGYQLEMKQDEIEILEQQAQIEELKSIRQRGIMFTIAAVGLLLLLLAGGLYNRFLFIRKTNRQIQVQKAEIEDQRDEIEAQRNQMEKQRDLVMAQKELITDSISYAQRIQSTLLPSQAGLEQLIPEHFIFFRPKDIVSGDFYWIREVEDHVVIVVSDCTGHGVPGAFMSMLGITMLNELVGDQCRNSPAEILDELRAKVKSILLQKGDSEDQKDGMELTLAILEKKSRHLHFAGANNPLYLIRKKENAAGPELEGHTSLENGEYQLYEIKGDKQPIGVHWEETPFTSHTLHLLESDSIYMFSDGFVDQYGGEHRKRFKTINFKKLLLSIQREPMTRQGEIIGETFESWKGDHEQLDDVSVFGARL